jgi:hypothetical protein
VSPLDGFPPDFVAIGALLVEAGPGLLDLTQSCQPTTQVSPTSAAAKIIFTGASRFLHGAKNGKGAFAWRDFVTICEAEMPSKFAALAYAPTVRRAVADEARAADLRKYKERARPLELEAEP